MPSLNNLNSFRWTRLERASLNYVKRAPEEHPQAATKKPRTREIDQQDTDREFTSPSLVVGIGASAGGLESLEKLFRNLPNDTGMAFVVLQHLSPDFKSMMFELLGRDTSMTIHRAEDKMLVEANSVYLLPPKKEMVIRGGRLELTDKDRNKGLRCRSTCS